MINTIKMPEYSKGMRRSFPGADDTIVVRDGSSDVEVRQRESLLETLTEFFPADEQDQQGLVKCETKERHGQDNEENERRQDDKSKCSIASPDNDIISSSKLRLRSPCFVS
ncbi:unnamed protein product [Amoebophrya sp. A25]|nr:unnamed protein product [Amoebophrya sp. A25]|eukprot:GSA25T00014641001.1